VIASPDVLEAGSDACTMNLVINPDDEAQMGDAVVAAGLRTWTTEQRGALTCRLTAMVRSSSRAAWQARHPERSVAVNNIAWAELQYGTVIGAALRAWQAKQATHP